MMIIGARGYCRSWYTDPQISNVLMYLTCAQHVIGAEHAFDRQVGPFTKGTDVYGSSMKRSRGRQGKACRRRGRGTNLDWFPNNETIYNLRVDPLPDTLMNTAVQDWGYQLDAIYCNYGRLTTLA